MIVSCISYPPIWRYFHSVLVTYILGCARVTFLYISGFFTYCFSLGTWAHTCTFFFFVLSNITTHPETPFVHSPHSWYIIVTHLRPFPFGQTGNIVVDHIMKTILDRLIRSTPAYTTKPKAGLIKRNRWRSMRLTTNIPKSRGRVIIPG